MADSPWVHQVLGHKSRVFAVPVGRVFATELARYIHVLACQEQVSLCAMTIYVPYRRFIKSLQQALLRESSRSAVVLPSILCLQDLWSVPPGLEHKRRGAMAKLIYEYHQSLNKPLSSLWLWVEEALAFLDQMHIENISGKIHNLPKAQHHIESQKFFEILMTYWPRIVEENGWTEPYIHHQNAMKDLCDQWIERPDSNWVLAAGST